MKQKSPLVRTTQTSQILRYFKGAEFDKIFNMDLTYIVIVSIGICAVKAQNTFNAMNSNSFDNRLLALEEENRRLGHRLQGKYPWLVHYSS